MLPLTPRPHGASGEIRTHDLRLTEAALCPLELQRQRSGSRTRICVRRFKDRPGSSNHPGMEPSPGADPGLLPYKGRVTAVCDGGAFGLRERGAATRCRPGPSAVRRRSRSRARRRELPSEDSNLDSLIQGQEACH